jgi:hypothetical protein
MGPKRIKCPFCFIYFYIQTVPSGVKSWIFLILENFISFLLITVSCEKNIKLPSYSLSRLYKHVIRS